MSQATRYTLNDTTIRCNDSIIEGTNVVVHGDRNKITGPGMVVHGNHNVVRQEEDTGPNDVWRRILEQIQQGVYDNVNSQAPRVTGNHNTVTAYYAKVTGNSNTVRGGDATVDGDDNTINGSYSKVTGDSNEINGNDAKVSGCDNVITGTYAKVRGNNNTVEGDSSEARGDGNHVTGQWAKATGNNNAVDGEHASANGNHNTVTGEDASATGSNNTVNGMSAEVYAQQRMDDLQREIQQYQQTMQQRTLRFDEIAGYQHLLIRQQLLISQDALRGQQQQLSIQLAQSRQQFNAQMAQVQARATAPSPVRGNTPRRRRRQAVAATAAIEPIKLNLRGEDEPAVDENDVSCLVCLTNKAIVASMCCGKRTTCLECTRTLYEGKNTGDVNCLNCRGAVSHVVRIS